MFLSIRKKLFITLFIINFFVSGTISYILYKVSTESYIKTFIESKHSIARATAQLIDGDLITKWSTNKDTQSNEYKIVQKLIQVIWENELNTSYLYIIRFNEKTNEFEYVVSHSYDFDAVWIEFKDLGLMLSVDKDSKYFIRYIDRDYYDEFKVLIQNKTYKAKFKKIENELKFFIEDEEIFALKNASPLQVITKNILIDKKTTYQSKFKYNINNIIHEARINFTEKNSSFGKPGEIAVSNIENKKNMKLILDSGKDFYENKFYETAYGDFLLITSILKNKKGNVTGLLCFDTPKFSVNQFKEKIRNTSYFVFIISFLFILLGSMILPIYLKNSIEKLLFATKKIKEEDYSFTIQMNTKDEFQTLADSFNSMSTSLKESKEKLNNYTEDLEVKVQIRTRELEESKKKAEEALKVKSDFLAVMSHEIRTPLNGVLGMSRLLTTTNLDVEQKDYIDNINSSGELLLLIMNDILDISKIDSGKIELDNIEFSIQDSVKSCIGIINAKLEEKNLSSNLIFENEIPEKVFGSETRYKQILINLLGNSIKFTESGSIEIKVKSNKTSTNQIEIITSIQDTGIGIEDSLKPLLFQPFTQGDSTLRRKYGGTGLGLSISKKLTEILGGDLSFSSEVGKGSLFIFKIPFISKDISLIENNKNKTEVKKNDSNLASEYPIKILVAEDNDVNQKLILKILSKFGYSADLAQNGQIAVEMAKEKKYDLIFMDIQMPIMDGVKATELILGHYKPVIIALTANVLENDKSLYKQVGFTDHIGKPYPIQSIKDAIIKYGRKVI